MDRGVDKEASPIIRTLAGHLRRIVSFPSREVLSTVARKDGWLRRRQARRDPDRVSIRADLAGLEDLMFRLEQIHAEDIAAVRPDHRPDAINLVHYLALRHGDLRHLQRRLGERGLSSLGRCEPHVLATVESVRAALDGTTTRFGPATLSFEEGRAALDRNTDALFGPRPPGRVPRVMGTVSGHQVDRPKAK